MTDTFSDRIPKAGGDIFFVAPVDADSREGYFRKILDELPAASTSSTSAGTESRRMTFGQNSIGGDAISSCDSVTI
jgi:hypothetical protein